MMDKQLNIRDFLSRFPDEFGKLEPMTKKLNRYMLRSPEKFQYLHKDLIFRKVTDKGVYSAREIFNIAPEMFEQEIPDTNPLSGLTNIPFDVCHFGDDGVFYWAQFPQVRGYHIPRKVLDGTLTSDEFFAYPSEELRSAIIEYCVNEDILRWLVDNVLKTEEVDTYVDKKTIEKLSNPNGMTVGVYTLFKSETAAVQIAFVRCYCPSSDRMFYLKVDPAHTSAKDAIASLCRPPKVLHPYIKSLSRQGERFIYYFNDLAKVKEILNDKEALKETAPLSGDFYFNNMIYEY
jgi:hypothetical protein